MEVWSMTESRGMEEAELHKEVRRNRDIETIFGRWDRELDNVLPSEDYCLPEDYIDGIGCFPKTGSKQEQIHYLNDMLDLKRGRYNEWEWDD